MGKKEATKTTRTITIAIIVIIIMPFIVIIALVTFGLVGLHLARVLFNVRFVVLHVALTFILGIAYVWRGSSLLLVLLVHICLRSCLLFAWLPYIQHGYLLFNWLGP